MSNLLSAENVTVTFGGAPAALGPSIPRNLIVPWVVAPAFRIGETSIAST